MVCTTTKLTALIALATCVACSTEPAESRRPLDIDVVMSHRGDQLFVELTIHEVNRPECNRNSQMPRLGECASWSDVPEPDCEPVRGTCLQTIRVERGGTTFDADPHDVAWSRRVVLPPGDGAAELVLSGCGGEARVDLALTPFPEPPVVDEFAFNDDGFIVHWASNTTSTAAVAWTEGGFGGTGCLGRDGTTEVPYFGNTPSVVVTGLHDDGVDRETSIGQVRVWRATRGDSIDVFVPGRRGDGLWELPHCSNCLSGTLTVDGTTTVIDGGIPYGGVAVNFGASVLDESLVLEANFASGDGLILSAGATTDTLSYRPEKFAPYTTTLPHIAPTDPLELGRPTGDTYVLDIPETTFAQGGSDEFTMSGHLVWTLGSIARHE